MQDNIPRASIHVGDNKKSFSAAESNEAERRRWDEKRYHQKNADKEKNNHYDFSRKKLNFEIVKGEKFVPLGYHDTPLNERIQQRLHDLDFKQYMDTKHPDKVADNSPNCTVTIIFGGDHDTLYRLAFGSQNVDIENPETDNSHAHLEQGIKDWALDTYRFACRKWGEDNIISFAVHCDETSIHAHVQTVPTAMIKAKGRGSVAYRKKTDPAIELSAKEWKLLPKEERLDYEKVKTERKAKESVSFAKVWGETPRALSATLSQLHTDYHEEVGRKYGLERGLEYDELTEEEKRSRKHKDKVTLEAERQAKLAMEKAKAEAVKAEEQKTKVEQETVKAERALDNVKEYAVLATIDRKELRFPMLNITKPVMEAKETVAKELSIPIPAVIGQKAWRDSRTANINMAIETLVTAINAARDSQNEGVRKSVNNQYAYYMQNLDKLIKANQALRTENDSIKAANNQVKQRISELDEHAVENLRKEKDAEISRLKKQLKEQGIELTNEKKDLTRIYSKYTSLVDTYNDLWQQPEFLAARDQYRRRKEHEAAELKVAKEREDQIREARKSDILDSFIIKGRNVLHAFAQSHNTHFDKETANSICNGIVATAVKKGLSLLSRDGIDSSVDNFLSGMSWSGCTDFREECVINWTKLYAIKDVKFEDSAINDFISFVDTMSCSQDSYVSLMGSNGCADQLTNWDGTQKRGLGAPTKTRKNGISK